MENFEILLIVVVSLAVGAALYEAFLQFTGKLKTKPFNPWTVPAGQVSPPAKDNWIRDGSKPPAAPDSFLTIEVLITVGCLKGTGRYDRITEEWGCLLFKTVGQTRLNYVDAWQKFPDYEKI